MISMKGPPVGMILVWHGRLIVLEACMGRIVRHGMTQLQRSACGIRGVTPTEACCRSTSS